MEVWVYECRHQADDDYSIRLFANRDDAYIMAVRRARQRLENVYSANDSSSDHHETYTMFMDAINDGDYEMALSHYNSWAGELDYDEQVYYHVNSHYVDGMEDPRPVNGVRKVRFEHGADCKKCKQHNEYIEESNQDDGTYLCGTCKALNAVFG